MGRNEPSEVVYIKRNKLSTDQVSKKAPQLSRPQSKPLNRDDFSVGKSIGAGAFGTVHRVEFKNFELEQRSNPRATKP